MSKRLYRFFDDVRWAEHMMLGSMRFRTLAYYRDYEEQTRLNVDKRADEQLMGHDSKEKPA